MDTSDESFNTNKINISLGDIIRIISPNNSKYDQKIYLVDYIDDKIIAIVNDEESDILYLGETGELTDFSIKELHLLKHNKSSSYTELNNLRSNTWIDIKFDGDIPVYMTGLITNVIEDMIEIKTYPQNDVIFIDFEYKGIPRDLNIEYIQIRDEPESIHNNETKKTMEKNEEESEKEEENNEENSEEQKEEAVENEESEKEEQNEEMVEKEEQEQTDNLNYEDEAPVEINIEEQQDFVLDMEDQDDILEMVTQYVNVSKSKQRYTLDEQKTDMMNKFLENIPYNKVNKEMTDIINKNISRYIELRELYSVFDENNNPSKIKINGNNYNPLENDFYKNAHKYRAFIPVVSLKKKLYDNNIEDNNIVNLIFENVLQEEISDYNDYINKRTNYLDYINSVGDSLKPYERIASKEEHYSLKAFDDIQSIVDNDDLYEIHCINGIDNNVIEQKYFLQKYVSDLVYNEKKIMLRETLDIKSLITLPFSVADLSRIHLFKSNILEKLNLCKRPYDHYKLFTEDLNLNTNLVTAHGDNFENSKKFDDVFIKATEHLLDDDIHKNKNNFEKYFKTVLPRSTDVIKYITSKYKFLSLYEYLKLAESYNVYTSNIHFYQYKMILDKLYKNINEFWSAIKKERAKYYKSFKSMTSFKYVNTDLIKRLDLLNEFNTGYNKSEIEFVSNSELLHFTNEFDSSNVLIEDIKFKTRDLINDVKINYDQLLEEETVNNETKECKQYNVAKKYKDIQSLNNDSEKEIYYDKFYDDTVYDIVNVYSKEKEEMERGQFISFLKDKLIQVNGVEEKEALNTAQNMVNGRKVVKNGDYAVLQDVSEDFQDSKLEYYIRDNNKWIFDEEATNNKINEAIPINNSICEEIMCHEKNNESKILKLNFDDAGKKPNESDNINVPVVSENNCVPSINKSKEMRKKLINSMMEEFKHRYIINEQLSEERLENIRQNNSKKISIKNSLNNKYQNYAIMLGSKVTEFNNNVSPNKKILDNILQIEDRYHRSEELLSFIHKYTRKAVYPEDGYSFYCKISNVKILPTFYFDIAKVISQNKYSFDNSDYIQVVNKIKKERGVENDQYIFDKYSGEIIAPIDFDLEEGYDESGHKINTRSAVDRTVDERLDDTEEIIDSIETDDLNNNITRESQEEFNKLNIKEFVSSIISYISNEINIDLGHHKEYTVYKVISIFDKYKNKKNEEYTLVLLTIAMLFVAIQMYFPRLTGRYIRVNDCKASFKGYPLGDQSDESGIEFFSCLIAKRKRNISKKIKQNDEAKIKEQLITIIKSFILDNIQEDIVNIQKEEEEKERILNIFISKNMTFLPPLKPYKIPTRLLENNLSNVKSNIRRQNDVLKDLNSIKSKNIIFSYSVLESINENIKSQQLSLQNYSTNEYYLENSCCSSKSVTNIIDYLKEKDNDIIRYINIVLENEKYIDETKYFPINYISRENYKIIERTVDNSYTNKSVELFFKKIVSDDDEFQEKTYGKMVQRLNEIYESSSKFQITDDSSISFHEYLISVFTKTKSVAVTNGNSEELHEKFIDYLEECKGIKEMKDIIIKKLELINYMDEVIKKKKNDYVLSTNDKSKENMIHKIVDFKSNNSIQMMKNMIKKYSFVIPSLLVNNYSIYKNIKLPKHWNLSGQHYYDIQNLILSDYTFMDKFKNNDNIMGVLPNMIYKFKEYEYLINNISLLSLDFENYFVDTNMVTKLLHIIFIDIYLYAFDKANNYEEKELLRLLMKEYNIQFKNYIKIFDFDIEILKKRVLKSKEREKDRMTKKLKKKSDDEREVSNILKQNKLGEWNIGEQKGHRIYDKNFRDDNRPEGEEFYNQQDQESEFFNASEDN